MPKFHNPYMFVPTERRDTTGPLGDREPVGHAVLADGSWTGKLTVEMVVKTPLLVPASDVEIDGDHKTKSTRHRNNKPAIPPSSVLSMVRSAFEMATNSRYGIITNEVLPRRAGDTTTTALDATLHPPRAIDQLSPAERVFGWVNDGAAPDDRSYSAYRGCVRCSDIHQFSDEPAITKLAGKEGVVLSTLGNPSTEAKRFYFNLLDNSRISTGMGPGVSGRKVYPHHKSFDQRAGRWREPGQRDGGPPRRRQTNQTILDWIAPGTVFRFNLFFTDISEVELGALIDCVDNSPDEFHRLGGAKPFGFGSVTLSVVVDESWIENSTQTRDRWLCLTPPSHDDTATKIKQCKESFTNIVRDTPHYRAYRKYLAGFTTNLAVRYPGRAWHEGQLGIRTIPSLLSDDWAMEEPDGPSQAARGQQPGGNNGPRRR